MKTTHPTLFFLAFAALFAPLLHAKPLIKDYSEYSQLLACLIRDLRKDLNAPNMPFVTGVIGVGGETKGDNTEAFRNAMAAIKDKALSEDEKYLLKNGSSNQGFHYYGSAKFFAQAGQAFAEAMAGMKRP